MTECNSCGAEANPDSERTFCNDCDAEFEAGLKNQEKIYARAYLLEEAKVKGNTNRVAEIAGEIAVESMVSTMPKPVNEDQVVLDAQNNPVQQSKFSLASSATAKKVEDK